MSAFVLFLQCVLNIKPVLNTFKILSVSCLSIANKISTYLHTCSVFFLTSVFADSAFKIKTVYQKLSKQKFPH